MESHVSLHNKRLNRSPNGRRRSRPRRLISLALVLLPEHPDLCFDFQAKPFHEERLNDIKCCSGFPLSPVLCSSHRTYLRVQLPGIMQLLANAQVFSSRTDFAAAVKRLPHQQFKIGASRVNGVNSTCFVRYVCQCSKKCKASVRAVPVNSIDGEW